MRCLVGYDLSGGTLLQCIVIGRPCRPCALSLLSYYNRSQSITYNGGSVNVVRSDMVRQRVEGNTGVVVRKQVSVAVLAVVLLLQGGRGGAGLGLVRAERTPFLLKSVFVTKVVFHVRLM